jgi:hypothetical protein
MPAPQEIREEQIRMIRLRMLADLTAYRLRHGDLRRQDALALIEKSRKAVLELCPGKGTVFDLILRPRFMRIVNERALAEWGAGDSMN